MGGRGGGGGGKVTNANAGGGGVPASARKVVQSLKEIVNCSELEIYTMLVECDMDPDETVNRLLSQDTFHEVKSKRDKKKETKDPADSWTRSSNISNRGGRSGNDSYNNTRGVTGGNKYNSNESGNANRRENGTRNNHWVTTTTAASSGLLGRQPPPSNSDFASVEVKKQPSDAAVASSSSSLPSNPPVYQSAWVNANPGQRTMADIVKMGKQKQHVASAPRSSETTTTQESKTVPLKDEWPSIEKQDVVLKPSFDETTTHLNDYEETKPDPIGSLPDAAPPVSVSSRNLLDDDFRDSSLREDENNNNDVERHTYENNDAEDVSVSVAAATGFEQLTIENEEDEEDEDYEEDAKEEKPAVIIPDHLQVHTSECSHLMFGSFGAPAIRSGDNLNEETHEEAEEDDSTFRHETEYYGEEEEEEEEETQQLRNDEQTSYQIDTTARNYHASSESETEPPTAPQQHEQPPPLQEDHHPQYKFSSSSSPADYGFENNQQHHHQSSETNPQIQNLDTFPNVMQHTLLQSGIQDPRGGESDLHHYSPFPTKYNNTTAPSPSSLTNPAAISMAEALRAASISPQQTASQQQQQAAAAALAQHLALNPYSHHQPGMPPLGHYGNLISYPFMPQSYNPYMPSAFQQAAAFPNNHQSLAAAAMLPQYKTQGTVAAAASPSAPPPPLPSGGYNNFGGLNPTSVANSYEDVLNSQFKDSNHLASQLQQQQNENWHQGQQQQQQPNSRVVPGSGYYSFPGQHQNQQPPGFRQAQQQLQQQQQQQQQQQYGGHSGYVSPYHSQAAAMSLDHLHHQHQQQQIARDASKQSQQQQLWPNNNY